MQRTETDDWHGLVSGQSETQKLDLKITGKPMTKLLTFTEGRKRKVRYFQYVFKSQWK